MSQKIDLNTVTATVDDAELLTILGLSSMPSSPMCNTLAVLDWDDMPELSEEEEEDDSSSVMTSKRKHSDDDDVFAEFDFVEVPLMANEQTKEEPEQKKRKVLQPSFVDDANEETLLNLNLNLQLDDDIQLALDLIS